MGSYFLTTSFSTFKQYFKSILWASVIIYLSLVHISSTTTVKATFIPHFDKLAHIFIYMIFSLLLLFENRKSRKTYLPLLIAVFFGVLMEILQHLLTTYRSMEIYDMLANTLGVILGMLIIRTIQKLFFSKNLSD